VGRTPLRTDASCGFRAIAPMVVYFTSPDLRALLPVDDPTLPFSSAPCLVLTKKKPTRCPPRPLPAPFLSPILQRRMVMSFVAA
jgi:hypothetical protein